MANTSRGRPQTVGGHGFSIYLADGYISIAKRLGGGNVSEGIRRALWVFVRPEDEHAIKAPASMTDTI